MIKIALLSILIGGPFVVYIFPENPLFSVTWYVILVLSAFLMHSFVRGLNIMRPTISSIWYITFLIMIYIPAFFISSEKLEPWRTNFLIGVSVGLLMTIIGIGIANYIAKFNIKEIQHFYIAPIINSRPSRIFAVVLIGAVIISTIIVVVYLFSLQTIPLVYMLLHPGDSATLMILREESFKLFDPSWQTEHGTNFFYILLFQRNLIFPLLVTLLLGYAMVTKKIGWILLFIYTLLLAGFYAAASIMRSPLAALFVRLFFSYYLINKSKISKGILILFTSLIVIFPLFVTSLSHGSGSALNVEKTLIDISRRITFSPANDLYYYFEIFPDNYPYLTGGALSKSFLKIFGRDYFYIENYVHLYIYPNSIRSGHANAAFISNLHADFGLLGIIIGCLLVGIFMQSIQIYLFRQPKTVLSIAVYSFCIYSIWTLNFGSVTSVLFAVGLLPVLLIYFIIAKFFYQYLHEHTNTPLGKISIHS